MITIGDIAEVKGGKRLPKGKLVQEAPTPYRYIRVTDFTPYGVNEKQVKFIDAEAQSKVARYTISDDDIYISIAGTIGLVGMIPPSLNGANLTENAAKICNISEAYSARYITYYLKSDRGIHEIRSRIVGTSQPKLALFRIKDIPLPEVPKETQDRVASVLSAYDNLITNNLQRIERLETMAQLLFSNDFRAEDTVPFLDCIEINPKVIIPKDGLKPYVPMESLRLNSMLIDFYDERGGNSGAKFKTGDTLFARITPSLENGKTSFVYELPDGHTAAFGSTEFIVMRSKSLSPELTYLVARSDKVRKTAIKSMVGASGRQRVQEKCFEEVTLPKLSDGQIERLTSKLRPLFEQINVLHKENRVLQRTRDLLLPRLLSGDVEV